MMGWYGGWGAGSWLGMGIGMLVFWGLVVAAVVALLRWSGQGRQQHASTGQTFSTGNANALRMLDERYARGDVTDEDYRRRRDVLMGR